MQIRPSDNPDEESESKAMISQALEIGAQDLITAIHSRDSKLVAEAIKSVFELLDAMPHEEGPHESEAE